MYREAKERRRGPGVELFSNEKKPSGFSIGKTDVQVDSAGQIGRKAGRRGGEGTMGETNKSWRQRQYDRPLSSQNEAPWNRACVGGFVEYVRDQR